MTIDIDISLLTGFGNEEPYIDNLIAQYKTRIEDAKNFALTRRVLLLESENGIGIDIALAALPYEETVINRATLFEFLPGLSLQTCSAEDLIIFKAFANRTRDWADIESIIIKQKQKIETDYVFENLKPLTEAKEAPDIIQKLNFLLSKYC